MYLKHYNLALKPFEISPDPKFLWLGEKHEEALAALKYGILDNKGFISLTGDAGTGKTTLVNALANSLGDNIIFAQIPDPALKQLDFLNLTADALKMNKKFSTKGDFLIHLRHFLNNAYVHHKEVVLVIEEAHRFDPERLEEVRLLSNIDKPDKKLINIVFVGQNEFNSLLKENKALRQRIVISHNINLLQEIETEQYVMHRLKIAGSDKEIFTPAAVREIYSFSKGNPRLINIICDSALLTGYAGEKKIIEPEIIKECAANFLLPKQQKENTIKDLSASSKSIPETGTGIQPGTSENAYQKADQKVRIKPPGRKLSYVIPMFVVILLSIFGYLYFFGENHALYRNLKTFLGQAFDNQTGLKSETSSQKPDETTKRQSNIAGTKVQALDLKNQKTSIDTQLVQLKSRNEELTAALEELKGAKERVAALEGVAIGREQTLFQSEQKVSVLTNALDREKKGRELLGSELSSKVGLIADLQKKLGNAQSDALEFEAEIENSTIKVNELQKQLSDLKSEKASAETQLGRLRSSYDKLSADFDELKGAKERVAELEGAVAMGGQKLTDLAKELDQEKQDREQLRSQLTIKADLVAQLQQKLAATLSSGAELEKDIEKSKNEILELQGQLLDLKAHKASSDTQLGQLRSRNEELTVDLEELKGAEERVVALEGAVAMGEQKLTDLAKELDQEKQDREQLSSQLTIKADLVAQLQLNLAATLSSGAELEKDIEKSKNEIGQLQGQLLDLKAQKASSDTQLVQLKSRNEALTADLEELKGAKERVAELTTKDQAISGSEERLSQLAKELDQEKESKGRLNSELSSKVDLIAELQEKLGYAQSNALEVETKIENSSRTINELQEQLSNLKSEKASAETQLSELRSRNDELSADLNQLKGAQDRVAELEGVAARRGQILSQSQQKLSELAEELDREKMSKETLNSELSIKADLITEFQQKLQTSQANQRGLEKTIKKSEKEIAELQNQLRELKAQQAPAESSAVIVDVKLKSTSPSEASGERGESPSPSDIIDWVLKKKAK